MREAAGRSALHAYCAVKAMNAVAVRAGLNENSAMPSSQLRPDGRTANH
ncbi:MAG: hypothetical protein WBO55_17835 [Rhizobiaceae bacterium]